MYRKLVNNGQISMTQNILKNFKPVYWLNSIFFENLNKDKVRKIGSLLMKEGIEVRSGFWPLNKKKGFIFKYVNGTTNKNKDLSKKIFEKSLVLPQVLI